MVLLHAIAVVLVLGFELDLVWPMFLFRIWNSCEVVGPRVVVIFGTVVVVVLELILFCFSVVLRIELVDDVFNVVDGGGSCVSIGSPVLLILGVSVSFPAEFLLSIEGEVEGDGVVSHKDCAINSAKRGTSKAVI